MWKHCNWKVKVMMKLVKLSSVRSRLWKVKVEKVKVTTLKFKIKEWKWWMKLVKLSSAKSKPWKVKVGKVKVKTLNFKINEWKWWMKVVQLSSAKFWPWKVKVEKVKVTTLKFIIAGDRWSWSSWIHIRPSCPVKFRPWVFRIHASVSVVEEIVIKSILFIQFFRVFAI